MACRAWESSDQSTEHSQRRFFSRKSRKEITSYFLLFFLYQPTLSCEQREKLADTRELEFLHLSLFGCESKQRRKIVFHDALNGAGFHARLENGQSPPPIPVDEWLVECLLRASLSGRQAEREEAGRRYRGAVQ